VRTLDLGLLQAGAGVKGEFENRLKNVIDEVKAMPAMKDMYGIGFDPHISSLVKFEASYVSETHHWADAAALQPVPGASLFDSATTYRTRAIGAARMGHLPEARQDLAMIEDIHKQLLQKKKNDQAKAVDNDRQKAEAWIDHAEGKNDEAQKIIDQSFICKGQGSEGTNYGCFQLLGHLDITYQHSDTGYDQYQRELCLDEAIARCRYRTGGTTYTREYFTSFGDDVAIIRLTADRPRQLNFQLTLDRPERARTSTEGNSLLMQGQLDNGIDGKGMQYLVRMPTEMRVLAIRDAAARNRGITHTPEFVRFGLFMRTFTERMSRSPGL